MPRPGRAGYRRVDFVDVWDRYLPSRIAASSASSASSQSQSQADIADIADIADTRDGSQNGVALLRCPVCETEKKVDKVRAGITYLSCGHQAPAEVRR